MISIPTTWRRNAMNIDMVGIMTSPHRMYNLFALDSKRAAGELLYEGNCRHVGVDR